MKLKALSMIDLDFVREWRNEQLELLRTPYPLTEEMQKDFYNKVISSRQAYSRFWGVWIKEQRTRHMLSPMPSVEFESDILIGMVGMENIQWENRLAEISLLLNPEYSTDEFLSKSLALVLHEGFMNLNMENIFTEVYDCSPRLRFWLNAGLEYDCAFEAALFRLPNRKYYNGKYWGSYYINFNKERYMEHENTISKPTQASN